jgi:alkanesulfonate monooxygenase SsuD/methylene tetrahydromethanopterin reductase-like flavin-dependent oxidoreductase (luciferase family)
MVSYGYLAPTRGVVLGSDGPASLAARTAADIVQVSKRAETLGFETIWVGDSVLAKPRLEPLTTLSAVAGATDAVGLGTAIYLPTLRDAVNVAHQTATLDQLSGGRLELGVGVGVGPDVEAEYENLDIPYRRRGALLDETLDVLAGLWTGESFDYDGEFYQLDGASIDFRPCRKPPIHVASLGFDPTEGFPRSIRERMITHGDGWLPGGYTPETYAAGLEGLRSFLAEAGRDPDRIDAGCYVDIVLADSEDEAIEQAREFLLAYYPTWDDLSDEDIRARGAFGPPEVVAETLDTYREAGVERFVVRFTAANQREQLGRFAQFLE